MRITDDGTGFNSGSVDRTNKQTWGLSLMEERAISVGGEFSVVSAPGKGTQIDVVVQ